MTDTDFLSIAQRRAEILGGIEAAASLRGGAPAVLVGVSKQQPGDRIETALAAGQRVYGENRVQEAGERWSGRRADYPDLELRLIGPLQTNKAEEAAALFDVIETLDRAKLARALAKAMEKAGRTVPVLVQVNTGEEPQKSGVLPTGLAALIGEACELGLQIDGLMCIPPVNEPAGPHFALLARLAQAHGLAQLSMGMSADYEMAIRFGATHVRVGAGLFGARAS